MSASDIQLKPSRLAQVLMAVLLVMPLLIMATVPMGNMWLLAMFIALLVFYWQGFAQWQRLQSMDAFTLTENGELHFVAPYRVVQLTGGLVCEQAILLRGNAVGVHAAFSRWVFFDQCSNMQFRALARAVNQCNWQGTPD